MAYQQKPNTGSLFKNDKKQNANQPDFKGSININGQDMWISAWKKSGKIGNFLSLSVQPKNQNQNQGYQNNSQPPQDDFW